MTGYVITALLIAAGAVLLVPATVLCVQCIAAVFPSRRRAAPSEGPRPSVAVLVPAHDESLVLAATIRSIQAQLLPCDRLVVVADNCHDDTAQIATSLGAEVTVREEPQLKGKAYALDWGRRWLLSDPREVVVVVDADCALRPGCVESIARLAANSDRPAQAAYTMPPPPSPKPVDFVSSFAILVKNVIRPRGMAQLGLPCLLHGAGMAFPLRVFRDAPLASDRLCEDGQLGIDLALAGTSPLFCEAARIEGYLPQAQAAAKVQRKRWGHGNLQIGCSELPRLLMAAVRTGRLELVGIALDLSVPPLSLLVTAWAAAFSLSLVAASLLTTWWPTAILAASGTMLVLALACGWIGFGRRELPTSTMLFAPWYLIAYLPQYLSYFVKRHAQWIRTERDQTPRDVADH